MHCSAEETSVHIATGTDIAKNASLYMPNLMRENVILRNKLWERNNLVLNHRSTLVLNGTLEFDVGSTSGEKVYKQVQGENVGPSYVWKDPKRSLRNSTSVRWLQMTLCGWETIRFCLKK